LFIHHVPESPSGTLAARQVHSPTAAIRPSLVNLLATTNWPMFDCFAFAGIIIMHSSDFRKSTGARFRVQRRVILVILPVV
jgi:hypothetical protein